MTDINVKRQHIELEDDDYWFEQPFSPKRLCILLQKNPSRMHYIEHWEDGDAATCRVQVATRPTPDVSDDTYTTDDGLVFEFRYPSKERGDYAIAAIQGAMYMAGWRRAPDYDVGKLRAFVPPSN